MPRSATNTPRVLVACAALLFACAHAQPPPPTIWATFFPYLAAFVWPMQPAADAPIEIYACSGINGAAALPPDPPLLHAGRLAAYDLALDDSTADQVNQLARAATSVADAHSQLATLLNSPELRAHVCASLAATRWFTALTLTDCPPAP